MKSFTFITAKIFLLSLLLLTAITANAQNARLRFDNLDYLEQKARDVVEVNIDGKVLELAKRVLLKVKDRDAKKVGVAISGLEGIYVRVFNFENENEYNPADIEIIRLQLQSPGWEKLANVRSKKEQSKN